LIDELNEGGDTGEDRGDFGLSAGNESPGYNSNKGVGAVVVLDQRAARVTLKPKKISQREKSTTKLVEAWII